MAGVCADVNEVAVRAIPATLVLMMIATRSINFSTILPLQSLAGFCAAI